MPSRVHPPSFFPRSRRQRVKQRAAIAAIAAGAFAVVGCSSSSTVDATATTVTTVSPGSSVPGSAPGSSVVGSDVPHHGVIDVEAVDFAFENLPRTIEAGSRLTLTNGAPSELHELVAIRLPDDEERSVSDLLRLPERELAALIGAAPPATVLLAAPGSPSIAAVGDGTLTEPGRYLILCSIPTGVDPATYLAAAAQAKGAPPQVEGGPPHFVSGMATDLVVV